MRNLFITLLMLTAISQANSQSDYDLSNNISIVQSPGSYDDGFSLGLIYEYQNPIVYVGTEIYLFPDLNGFDYAHAILKTGLNHRFLGQINPLIRLYAGPRIGFIARESAKGPLVLLGLEAGFDINITDRIFIGLSFSSDMKTDSKPLWGENNHTVNSGYYRLGFKF